ncbi:DNA-binding protein HU [Campylobacter iguaniorum]|uniref:DNA-binding protein HU n=1 Tax=Campylobacter iguaniorum TaxID=1244531 RepID=A0A076F9H9_9BACT|nr:HU family DNA-binding protein [Campylobacter iguaniorum]AII14661.1 DNA-binding protein HU [Campylobacter iguaniorum]ANE35822.1 DNA-binding protein HU [Campylobacter iguaniorum]
MKKADFIDLVAKKAGLTKKDASVAVNSVVDSICESLCAGKDVSFIGFGSFNVVEKAAREGKIPGSDKTYKTAASKSVKFKVGKNLKDAVAAKSCKSSKCAKK